MVFSLESDRQTSPQVYKTLRSILADLINVVVWYSSRDYVIYLYLEIPESFVDFILQKRFGFAYLQFVRMVKLQFLVQFLVDQLTQTVVSSLIFFLHLFAAFIYYY